MPTDALVVANSRALALTQAHRRSQLSGVDPLTRIDALDVLDVDDQTPLVRAGSPVLEQMTQDLQDLPLAILLADRHGLVVAVRTPISRGFGAEVARSRLGRRCSEENVGTNALGTALELGQPLRLLGEEHYLADLADYDCLGAPIGNPVSGRAEGALSLCGGRQALDPALAPFLAYAARDIAKSLLALRPRSHAELLQVFHEASRQHSAVVVLGAGLVLASPAATIMLDPLDHTMLDHRGAELRRDQQLTEDVELNSGRGVTLTMSRCGATGSGLLIRLVPHGAARPRVPRGRNAMVSTAVALSREVDTARRGGLCTLITGERGTGRTDLVRQLAGSADIDVVDGTQEVLDPERWRHNLQAVLDRAIDTGSLVVLDRVEELSADAALVVSGLLSASAAWFAVLAPPLDHLRGQHAALAAGCHSHVHLPPLRSRHEELADLLDDVSARSRVATSVPLRWTQEALTVLRAHPWPGNFYEMQAMVEHVARTAVNGSVTVADLPSSVKSLPRRQLTPLQRADREVIAAHLRACHGNKVHVARALGISRSTLYSKLRELELTALA